MRCIRCFGAHPFTKLHIWPTLGRCCPPIARSSANQLARTQALQHPVRVGNAFTHSTHDVVILRPEAERGNLRFSFLVPPLWWVGGFGPKELATTLLRSTTLGMCGQDSRGSLRERGRGNSLTHCPWADSSGGIARRLGLTRLQIRQRPRSNACYISLARLKGPTTFRRS